MCKVPHNFVATIKAIYQSQQTRHAIKTALAAIIAVVIYQFFNMPKGYWAVVTAVIIMQSNMDSGSFEVTLKLATQRLVGTVSGAVVGFGLIFLINPNYWQLLVIIFVCILAASYLTKFYKGMTLAGPTAVIVLLLAHHAPITQSLAAMRTLEILLGVVVAIVVTVFVWPYQVTDHLKLNRIKRLGMLQQQFSELISVEDSKPLKADWENKQNKLIALVKDETSYVALAKKELKSHEQNKLRVELRLVKSLTRLGETLPDLPEGYWKSESLKASTQDLVASLASTVSSLSDKKHLKKEKAKMKKNSNAFLKEFKSFRSKYQKSKKSSFTIEEIYQIFTAYQSLQECVEMTEVLIDL